jgi:hypothetical protein
MKGTTMNQDIKAQVDRINGAIAQQVRIVATFESGFAAGDWHVIGAEYAPEGGFNWVNLTAQNLTATHEFAQSKGFYCLSLLPGMKSWAGIMDQLDRAGR